MTSVQIQFSPNQFYKIKFESKSLLAYATPNTYVTKSYASIFIF